MVVCGLSLTGYLAFLRDFAAMSLFRSPSNPIIVPADVRPSRGDFEVVGVFNAGVARFRDEVVLLVRVAERPIGSQGDVALVAVYDSGKNEMVVREFSRSDPQNDFSDPRFVIRPTEKFLTSISHLRLARSSDGIKFEIDSDVTIGAANDYETFGIEDPRITVIGGVYYIHYVAVSPLGVVTCLMSTKDFVDFKRHGVIFCPDNKDVVIFPEKIDGKYYALHRPVSSLFDSYEVWMAESPDLNCWGNHRYLAGARSGCWDNKKIGPGAVPFRIDEGWVEIYHGVDQDDRYCLGAILLDGQQPWKILARSKRPIFEPATDYECDGFFGNVVFSCGVLYDNRTLRIYYGAADTSIAYAELPIQDVLRGL